MFKGMMVLLQDEDYMYEALRLAKHALGRTSPNPLVGAVIVREGRIIASGWHRQAGTAHAEIHALQMAGELARGAVLYVTLEPCSHYGRTGPCAKAIVAAGVRRVVIAMQDPNPLVAGKGIAILQAAGIEVVCGVLENEARRLNEVFLKWITTKMPFTVLKMAMSLDGKIADAGGASEWITNAESRQAVHELRDQYDGILTGIGTVLADDPQLTARLPEGNGHNPLRIVADSRARIPLDARILTDGQAKTLIAVTQAAPTEKVAALRASGAEVVCVNEGPEVDLHKLFQYLGQHEVTSLLAEGGGEMSFSLLKAGLVDKVCAFIAPKIIGGRAALTPVEGSGFPLAEAVYLTDTHWDDFNGDLCITGYIRK